MCIFIYTNRQMRAICTILYMILSISKEMKERLVCYICRIDRINEKIFCHLPQTKLSLTSMT